MRVASLTPGEAALLATVFEPYAPPTEANLFDIARLPYAEAQAILAAGGKRGHTIFTSCGWHGTSADPRRGSYALVSPYGPLAGTAGQVVRITPQEGIGAKTIYAYVLSDQAAIEDDPLTVTRTLFQMIGLLTAYDLRVAVEVLG